MRAGHLIAVATVLLAGCSRAPESQSPPEQRAPLENTGGAPTMMVSMGGPAGEASIASDILKGPAESWRWTNQKPRVHVHLGETAGVRLHADFAIAEVTFKETGPVTIKWIVNDKLLDTVKYDFPGVKMFEKEVPEQYLKADSENTVGADIDKVHVSEKDGVKLGMILTKIGFVK